MRWQNCSRSISYKTKIPLLQNENSQYKGILPLALYRELVDKIPTDTARKPLQETVKTSTFHTFHLLLFHLLLHLFLPLLVFVFALFLLWIPCFRKFILVFLLGLVRGGR